MDEDDPVISDATATGILQCLRMLADEAASLRLTRTLMALREAIRACDAERTDGECEMDDDCEMAGGIDGAIDIDEFPMHAERVLH